MRRSQAPRTSSCATAPRSTCPAVADDVDAVAAFSGWPVGRRALVSLPGGGISAGRSARGLIDRGVGLAATAGVDGHVVAHACFVPEPQDDRAELAFAVADAWQDAGSPR
jgi:hypothetical protein